MFTLFFDQTGQAQKWSWLGWTPTGPFDSSDQTVEKFVGWHFNTKQKDRPATFADIGQYRQQNHGKGLMKTLIETGAVPLMWPPLPEPNMSLQFREGDDPLLKLDTERRVRVRTKDVKAYLDLPGFPIDKIDRDKLVWQVDDGPAKPLVPHESLRGSYVADLSAFDWKPKPELASHKLRVSLEDENPSARAVHLRAGNRVRAGSPAAAAGSGAYEEPLPASKLPTPTITLPAANAVFYQGRDQKQTPIRVDLTPSQAQALAGKLTFQVNGSTVQKDGKPLTKAVQGTPERHRRDHPAGKRREPDSRAAGIGDRQGSAVLRNGRGLLSPAPRSGRSEGPAGHQKPDRDGLLRDQEPRRFAAARSQVRRGQPGAVGCERSARTETETCR